MLNNVLFRVQGLLYKNAMDSFGQLTEGMMYHFPHFQPIAGEHFKYRADRDELVAEDAEQSDFIRTRERMLICLRSRPKALSLGGWEQARGR